MNIVIPMAGKGSRFAEQGYTLPKPLIDVRGKPMILRVLDNLNLPGKYIFIVQQQHEELLVPILKIWSSAAEIVTIKEVTEGAACTCLLAKNYIDPEDHLVVANCDQIMDWEPEAFIQATNTTDVDGFVLTFSSKSPNNSYAKVNRLGFITRVAEKELISDIATCGVYHWSKGKYMVESCEKMIAASKRVRNEFYLCPSYNEMIEDGYILKPFPVKAHYPIGTPTELEAYYGLLPN